MHVHTRMYSVYIQARNHVRTMLHGRRAYHIYKRRQLKSFFFPQRLWMALGLSLWIQVREG